MQAPGPGLVQVGPSLKKAQYAEANMIIPQQRREIKCWIYLVPCACDSAFLNVASDRRIDRARGGDHSKRRK
jgi:hypothetical protein